MSAFDGKARYLCVHRQHPAAHTRELGAAQRQAARHVQPTDDVIEGLTDDAHQRICSRCRTQTRATPPKRRASDGAAAAAALPRAQRAKMTHTHAAAAAASVAAVVQPALTSPHTEAVGQLAAAAAPAFLRSASAPALQSGQWSARTQTCDAGLRAHALTRILRGR